MYLQSDIYKNIPVSFDFIITWNQRVFCVRPVYKKLFKVLRGANELQFTLHMHSGINRITLWMGIDTLQNVRHNAHMHQMILRAKIGGIRGLQVQTRYIGVRKATRGIFVYRAKKFRLI